MAERGAFITVEGVDGAGKSTQLRFIENRLSDLGIEVFRTREPGGTPLGERLRQLLLEEDNLSICDLSELLMVFAARRQHLVERILPTLDQGVWVLSDRFTDATYAYQGAGRGIDPVRIQILESWVQETLVPDLTVVLDVSVHVGTVRSDLRAGGVDRFESQHPAFKQAVRRCYLERATRYPGRIRVVNAEGSEASVNAQISDVLSEFLMTRQGH